MGGLTPGCERFAQNIREFLPMNHAVKPQLAFYVSTSNRKPGNHYCTDTNVEFSSLHVVQ